MLLYFNALEKIKQEKKNKYKKKIDFLINMTNDIMLKYLIS